MLNRELSPRKTPDISWEKLNQEVESLATKIVETPDLIAPIVRGGLVPGRILSSCLGVNEMLPLMVEKRDEGRVVTSETTRDLRGKVVLLVEDALETGRSLIVAKDYLVKKGATVITACLYTTPKSEIKPDYSLEEVAKIPIFPWE